MAANRSAQESTPKRYLPSLWIGSDEYGMDVQYHSPNKFARKAPGVSIEVYFATNQAPKKPRKISLLPIALGLTLSACQTMPEIEPIHGPTNPTPEDAAKAKVKYYCSIIELRPEKEKEYRELHANVLAEVQAAIAKANIRNFNIYITEIAGKRLLVSHFEYIGMNPEADLASIGNDPTTKNKWWPLTDACQIRLPGTPEGSQWLGMEQVMHLD